MAYLLSQYLVVDPRVGILALKPRIMYFNLYFSQLLFGSTATKSMQASLVVNVKLVASQ